MMINSFDNYLKQGKVKRQTPNPEEARALLEKAKLRVEYSKSRMIDGRTAQFSLEDSYEALREAVQSLMALKGYKPYSHEATISFIKEFYDFPAEDIFEFDRFRRIRNDSVYGAVPVSIEDAKECMVFASRFIGLIEKV
jgi:uncharacterized protein (UPF0332 family)